ncbi:MAG: ImmA/IrrE family metallo-endopeptidase [Planctomycetota bacterium]|nr:MAG: ImmA/IrrE family metallo-endopeptidase [Planctomycetota bacterium]
MTTNTTDLAREALERSLEVRDEHDYDYRSPLCVYELCDKARVSVRFVDDVSMEGVYAALSKPSIILSSLRPLTRRAFTCAHEFGHHVFGHGSTIDELKDEAEREVFNPEEFLVEAFAGYLLMPAQAVKRAFSSRQLRMDDATPEDIYAVASSFGVGYETLIGHLAYGLRYIQRDRAETLRKTKLPKIRERILGERTQEHLVIADRHHAIGTLDAEVGNLVLLPEGAETESDRIEPVKDLVAGRVFRAVRPGLARVEAEGFGVIVRVSRMQYAGLARYRHLEETDGE